LSNKKITEIARVSEEAWQLAQKVVTDFSNVPPPVPLAKLAKAWRIRGVRFEPLWSVAGLAKAGDDFEIVVNKEAFVLGDEVGSHIEVGDGKWSHFLPPLRFTLAHEIAHMIFLHVAGGDSRSDLFHKNGRAVENACNILARVFLMPKQMLVPQIQDDLLHVDRVRELLDAFRVSPEVFVRRMHLSDMYGAFGNLDGLLALVEERDRVFHVTACHIVGYHALDRFNRALKGDKKRKKGAHQSLSKGFSQTEWELEGQPLVKLQLGDDIESFLRSAASGQKKFEVLWHPDEKDIIPCDFAFHRISGKTPLFLVGIKITGSKQKVAQKTLL
jgi:hypothetical protein